MPNRRAKDPAPDLFATAASKTPPPEKQNAAPQAKAEPTAPSAPRRYMLPNDLASALTRLDDGEIDALLVAVTDEAKRRGRLPRQGTETPASKFLEENRQSERAPRVRSRSKPVQSRTGRAVAGDDAPSLTFGKANAVRAAFMAGVKPSAIARQFGISQAAVRQVLATEARGQKP